MNKDQGIDYGLGKANIDDDGFRYGVIHQNEVLQAWCDESEPYYGNDTESWSEEDWDYAEPLSFVYSDGEYEAECDEGGDIFILRSPYFTYAQFCSPCAPGAVYLTNPIEPSESNKGYCFGHDWFESGKAPYPVYSVKTGKLVESDNKTNLTELCAFGL